MPFNTSLHRVAAMTVVMLMLPIWQQAWGRVSSAREYVDTPFVLNDSCRSVMLDVNADSYILDIRAAIDGIGERPGLAPNYWGVEFAGVSDTLRLSLRHGNTSFGDIFDRRQSLLTLTENGRVVAEMDADGFDSSSGSYNTLQFRIDRKKGMIEVRGGGKKMVGLMSESINPADWLNQASVWSKGRLEVASFTLESAMSPQRALATGWDTDRLAVRLKEQIDAVEGYWNYLDRENDIRYARPGGRYQLAVVKNEVDGAYDILYVGGAETLASEWQPMMLKGRLKPTIFVDHYDLEWIDSTFEPIKRDIHAQMTDGSILTLSFPLLKTTLRFSKMPLKKE